MKRIGLVLSALALIVLLLVVVGCGTTVQTSATPNVPALMAETKLGGPLGVIWSQQQVGLWVNGEGKVKAVADTVLLTLGIEAEAKTVAQAQQQAATAMNDVMRALKSGGIADKDIQTQRFSIYPVRKWIEDEQREVTIGYRVSNAVLVKIRDIGKAGSIIDAVAQAGGDMTRINNINFTVDNPTPYYKEARDKAVADGMAKAKQIAGVAGVKLGDLIYVSEGALYTPQVERNFLVGAMKGAADATPISAGELEFQLNIQMVYEID